VRALARDLGEGLGSGAYLAALVRTASGPFRLEDADSLETVRSALAEGRADRVLRPPDTGLDAFPLVHPDATELEALVRGQAIRLPGPISRAAAGEGRVRVADERGRLVAIARTVGDRLQPEKVLRTADEVDRPAPVGAAG
jgi:tRNA pseudouridine55 synthase